MRVPFLIRNTKDGKKKWGETERLELTSNLIKKPG